MRTSISIIIMMILFALIIYLYWNGAKTVLELNGNELNNPIRNLIKHQGKHWIFTNRKDNGILIDLDGIEYKQQFIKGFYWRTK